MDQDLPLESTEREPARADTQKEDVAWKNIFIFIVFLILLYLLALGPGRNLSLDRFQARRQALHHYVEQHPIRSIGLYLVIYVFVAAMALPGAAVLTMIGGDIFGPVNAVLYVVIGATIGATLAFGAARGLIRDWVEARYPRAVTWLQTAVGNDPVGTMLALRFIPAFPFFAVNLVAGLTRIRPLTYILTTLFGIIPGTFLYAYAGRQLGEVRSVNELARPSVLAAMFVVGFSVLVPGWLASRWRGSNRNKRTGGGDAIRGPEPRERSSPPPSPSSIPPASGP